MEKFKENIKKRNKGLVFIIFIIFLVNSGLYLFNQNRLINSSALGFQIGVLIGMSGLCMIRIGQYQKAIKNEKQLKRLYIQENDERKALVKQKMALGSLFTSMLAIIIAASFALYYDEKVAITLISTVFMIALISIAYKFYYLRKF